MLSSLVVSLDFFFRVKPRNLNVNDILDILDEDEDINLDKIFINPPEGEDSDGCDLSDEEEGGGDRDLLARPVLLANVAEIRVFAGNVEAFHGEVDGGEEEERDDDYQPELKKPRDEFVWESTPRSFQSRDQPIFPDGDYTSFKEKTPRQLFGLFVDDDLLKRLAVTSNEYAMALDGSSPNISSDDIQNYIGVLLLSGYVSVVKYEYYWSNSEDTENILIKKAISRDRFRTIKKYFHLGKDEELEAKGVTDRYHKVRSLMKHMQKRFVALFVPEQELSHDESMIKYFGKSGLKQSIRNKPIRFGFKAWVLATPSGYVVTFDLYQGKGVGPLNEQHTKMVGSSGASLLDLIHQLDDEKKELPYHFFADNFFSSNKLVDYLR